MSRTVTTKYAARNADGSFAAEGHETGMGRAIVRTLDINAAKLSTSIVGLMTWMGGHYRGTEAVLVTITTNIEIGEPVAYPAESDVWP
jgi:hypothetical protein